MAFLDETGLAELWSLVKAEDAKVLAADLKIVTGTYAGGVSSGVVTVTTGFEPKLVVVMRRTDGNDSSEQVMVFRTNDVEILLERASTHYSKTKSVALTGTGFEVTGSASYKIGLNYSGYTYGYFAFG